MVLKTFIFAFLFCLTALAQVKAPVSYISDIDRSLFIEKISIVPLIDNVGQIYSKPLTESTTQFFEKNKQWIPVLSKVKPTSENISPNEIMKITGADSTQAVLAGKVWKGPQGVQIKIILYLAADGQPFLIESADGINEFSTENLSRELTKKLLSLYEKMPIQGAVLSRRGNEVTVNLGTHHGIKNGDIINVVQILQVQRHPKQQFMVGHQKTLLGQIRVTQSDEFLSFGQVSMEKEPGVVQANANIKPDQFIHYVLADDGTIISMKDKLANRPESDVAFGNKPDEWRPKAPPQYGRLQLEAGFVQYNENLALQSAGSLSASTSLGPTVALAGEAWLNDDWYIDLGFRQSAFSVDNSLSGSSPSKINMSLGEYNLGIGYNFLLEDNFWGPKFQVSLGISQFSSRADESSPIYLTNMSYGGMYLGFKGMLPLGEESPLDLGFQFKYYLTSTVNESKSSGSASGVKITDFGFFGSWKTKKGYNIIGEIKFDYYTSNFDGTGVRPDPASSISHKVTSLLGGVEYFF